MQITVPDNLDDASLEELRDLELTLRDTLKEIDEKVSKRAENEAKEEKLQDGKDGIYFVDVEVTGWVRFVCPSEDSSATHESVRQDIHEELAAPETRTLVLRDSKISSGRMKVRLVTETQTFDRRTTNALERIQTDPGDIVVQVQVPAWETIIIPKSSVEESPLIPKDAVVERLHDKASNGIFKTGIVHTGPLDTVDPRSITSVKRLHETTLTTIVTNTPLPTS